MTVIVTSVLPNQPYGRQAEEAMVEAGEEWESAFDEAERNDFHLSEEAEEELRSSPVGAKLAWRLAKNCNSEAAQNLERLSPEDQRKQIRRWVEELGDKLDTPVRKLHGLEEAESSIPLDSEKISLRKYIDLRNAQVREKRSNRKWR